MPDSLLAKYERAYAAIRNNPDLSDRATALLANVSPHTIATIKTNLEIRSNQRREISGRRARGKPITLEIAADPDVVDRMPDGGATVYRCYGTRKLPSNRGPLLYVGCSMKILQRLANHSTARSWYRDIATVQFTHYRTVGAALIAETRIIRNERPLYNVISNTINDTRHLRAIAKRKLKRRPQDESAAIPLSKHISSVTRERALQRHTEMLQQAATRSAGKSRIRRPNSSSSQSA